MCIWQAAPFLLPNIYGTTSKQIASQGGGGREVTCWSSSSSVRWEEWTELLTGAINEWTRPVIKSGTAYKQSFCASTIQSKVH